MGGGSMRRGRRGGWHEDGRERGQGEKQEEGTRGGCRGVCSMKREEGGKA